MNRSIQSKLGAAVLALTALGAVSAANAASDVHFAVRVQTQPVVVRPAPVVHMGPHQVVPAAPGYVYEEPYQRQRQWRQRCHARGWNPEVRYLPGERVWRNGELYVARRVSASVWNVNSPPEWTPSYWRPARCD
jgi:hypothetical protein